jgi:hypothetical protein
VAERRSRGTYVGDSERREIVSLEFAAHALATALGCAALAQMRRHVRAATCTETALCLCALFRHRIRCRRCAIVRRRHRVFERTSSREMLALTDTALDLLVAQLLLQTLLLGLATALLCLLCLHILPVS